MTYIVRGSGFDEIAKVEAVSKEQALLIYLKRELENERFGIEDICSWMNLDIQNLDDIETYYE